MSDFSEHYLTESESNETTAFSVYFTLQGLKNKLYSIKWTTQRNSEARRLLKVCPSACPSVSHTPESRLNGSQYRNMLCIIR